MDSSYPKDSVRRAAHLAGAGLSVGLNYAKRGLNAGTAEEEEFHRRNAERIYATLDRLKGIPLKVAQMLSLDREMLPGAAVNELSRSHRTVSPLSYSMVWGAFQRTLGESPADLFDTFSTEAECGASLGQVHRASKDGKALAVKIKYPNIEKTFQNDMRLIRPLLTQVLRLDRNTADAFHREILDRLYEEGDYNFELNRSIKISEACAGNVKGVRFPQYYPELSSKDILTMDWVEGESLEQFANGRAQQKRRNRIGQALWDFFSFQSHELRLFHADPNLGNFKVKGNDLWVLDFGCTKSLDEETYRSHFEPMRPAVLHSDTLVYQAFEALSPEFDRNRHHQLMASVGRDALEVLSRPFRAEVFDFGDPAFIEAVFGIHQMFISEQQLSRVRGFATSPDAVFLTRAWLGLYRLLARIRAQVKIELPDWMK